MSPLVSVMTPAFNAASTLPYAMASLLLQEFHDWEWLVLDDGSDDHPEEVLACWPDPRVRLHRLERNRGRGYARQRLLELATGKYIAMLDADDWYTPDKLRRQVELLESRPGTDCVSCGLYVVDRDDNLSGVRMASSDEVLFGRVERPAMPPMCFAPSMLRRECAQLSWFDPSYPVSEDADFLLRAILGRQYAIIQRPMYVYRELGSVTPEKVRLSQHYTEKMFLRYLRKCPTRVALEIARLRAKGVVYTLGAMTGQWEALLRMRSQSPSAEQGRQYDAERERMNTVVAGRFTERSVSGALKAL